LAGGERRVRLLLTAGEQREAVARSAVVGDVEAPLIAFARRRRQRDDQPLRILREREGAAARANRVDDERAAVEDEHRARAAHRQVDLFFSGDGAVVHVEVERHRVVRDVDGCGRDRRLRADQRFSGRQQNGEHGCGENHLPRAHETTELGVVPLRRAWKRLWLERYPFRAPLSDIDEAIGSGV
jgi:hypothetical protein